jgi:hypothetical protein
MTARQTLSLEVRRRAAEVAAARPQVEHHSNGDEARQRDEANKPTYVGNFTKCLPHDRDGFLVDPTDYDEWVRAIDSADPDDFERLRIGPGPFRHDGELEFEAPGRPKLKWAAKYDEEQKPKLRGWESQGAGSTFDLEGPDAQSVTMPPAPSLDSHELISEMGEVYWMALGRDIPFAAWDKEPTITNAARSLARLWWFRADRTESLDGRTDRLASSQARRRILSADGSDPVPLQKLFRGTVPGAQVGPYLSQFLLVGNRGINANDRERSIADGLISYGGIRIDQRVRRARAINYLTDWEHFLDVQNGADTRGRELYDPGHRFMATPRDLATYVHYDALYEAYLNACIILLGLGAPFDPELPFLRPDFEDKQLGFAQFGGPHILTLVTEVATRALKAVRYQKFNVHRRLRPEAVGGWLFKRREGKPDVLDRLTDLEPMERAFLGSSGVGKAIDAVNGKDNWLLPMAFTEGSPTHPSYGAGHAAVAGACVTILKAWFDHGWVLRDGGKPFAYEAAPDGSSLVAVPPSSLDRPLTVEGELNKLASNIAVGRNWAGVHYFSDYYESVRLGERVALGLLEEQKLTYGETFSMTVPLFDGTSVRI